MEEKQQRAATETRGKQGISEKDTESDWGRVPPYGVCQRGPLQGAHEQGVTVPGGPTTC